MREIFIEYNPYRLETSITIDGAAPKQNSRLNFGERRLQEWIEELPEILFEECCSRDFRITFHGTILDYEDVEAMAKEAKKSGLNIELKHIPAKEVGDKESAIDEIFDEIQAGPFEELKQPNLIRAFNLAKGKEFEVNVVATMSAGKSTLINALLGQKLMPAKQEACTATITKIKDNDSDHFMAKVYDANDNLIKVQPELSLETMNDLNSNPQVSRIEVEGNIPFVTADDVALVLVDTPGPNNSRDPEHRAATVRMLKESSKAVVLYILNATQLAVNDDYSLLNYVAESMRVGGKQSRDRFIFVVNKLDEFNKKEDNIEAALKKVRDYLHDNGIENPNIYPASALTALNIRTILAESDDDDDDDVYEAKGKVKKFNKNEEMYFEKMAPLTPSIRGEIESQLIKMRNSGDIKGEALIHCGIVPIEMAIRTYVQKYAKTAKIKNIVDTFSKCLESAKSFESTKQEIAENQEKKQEILAKIEIINKKLASGEEAKKFKVKIIKNEDYKSIIRKKVKKIKLLLQEKITAKIGLSENDKMSKREAEEAYKGFEEYAAKLQAEIKVEMESLIKSCVYDAAKKSLKEYKEKISELAQELNVGEIRIDPLKMMEGDINRLNNIEAELSESEKTEKEWEVVGNHKKYKEVIGFRRWMNDTFGTNFDVDYDIIDDYGWVEHTYINGAELSERFFSRVEENLRANVDQAAIKAEEQAENIKEQFMKEFEELDKILEKKLRELKACAEDNENVEQRLYASKAKLNWLEDIQNRIRSILDI